MVITMFALDRWNRDRGRGDQVCGRAFQKFDGNTRRWFDRGGMTESARVLALEAAASQWF